MGALTGLEPASVFHYFEAICGIPHTSHHEKALLQKFREGAWPCLPSG